MNFHFVRSFCRAKDGSLKNTTNRLNSLISRIETHSDWMSSLTNSMSNHVDSSTIYIVVSDEHSSLCKTEKISKFNLSVVTLKSLYNCIESKSDLLFARNLPNFTPPKNITSFYYAAGHNIYPPNKECWSRILYCIGQNNSPNTLKWIKCADPNFWKPSNKEKEYDFVCLGRKGKDENLIKDIAKKYPDKKIIVTDMNIKAANVTNISRIFCPKEILKLLQKSKWAIASSCIEEGWPMSIQLEYSMTGLPYIFNDRLPKEDYYLNSKTGVHINNIEFDQWEEMSKIAREYAVSHLSSDVSAKNLYESFQALS